MVDTSKKSNIKCEHCHYWNRYKCHNEHSPKWNKEVNYWNRCKEFHWNVRIRQEMEMKAFAIKELEKIKTEINEYLIASFADDEDFRWFNLCLDTHIKELNNE